MEPKESNDLKIIKYGLIHKETNKILTYSSTNNDGVEFSVSDSYELSTFEYDNIWMVDEKKIAEKAKKPTKWYNADYESPSHEFNDKELKVVKIKLVIEEEYE